ncbi:MAG: leucine-rich repeat protein [Candidatus Faecousia sp.]|uniref:leucine-rich repeat protein n=1 Tax=Faecousia sp. TaxID=2952921 RepID=UPI002A906CF8|nr:leucine-rich repeat protein [Candidatus Faecousia sp.]
MKKRLLALLLCAVMVCAVFVQAAPGVFAEGLAYMQCGKNLTAVLNLDTGVMTFEGTGEFYKNDFDGDEFVWFDTWAVELKEVAIPEGITYIPFALFGSCYNLERVTLPSTLKTIDVGAFQYCGSLQRIAIPAKVSAIDSTAFSGCTGLMQIEVDPANRTYCSDADGALYTKDKATLVAFPGGRSGSYTVAAATRTIAHDAFSNSALSSITLPDRLSTIEYSAFKYCSALAGLIIPAGVTELQTPICFGCEKLSGIWVDVANKHYANDAVGVLYSKDFSVLLECPDGLTGKYTVRDGTSRIDFGAFDGSALTEVALPDSVTVIDAFAFYGCTGLNEIVIPSGVKEIGDRAFYACENLKAVYFLGNAPETVGECAFQISYYDDSTDTSSDINIPGLTLYYLEGASGWTSPTWGADAYPTAVWKPSGYFDVKPGSWYEQPVQYATEHGLMNGTGTNTFEPESTMTRAMLVTVLWRYANAPKPGANPFTDVPNGKWYTDAVAWAAENGVVNGVGDGKFEPDGSVTREQMATILYRYAQKVGIDTSKHTELSAFPDASRVSAYARAPMQWIVAEGVIGGSRENGQDWLNPQGNATRAEVATILMRFIENVAKRPQ